MTRFRVCPPDLPPAEGWTDVHWGEPLAACEFADVGELALDRVFARYPADIRENALRAFWEVLPAGGRLHLHDVDFLSLCDAVSAGHVEAADGAAALEGTARPVTRAEVQQLAAAAGLGRPHAAAYSRPHFFNLTFVKERP